METLAAFLLMAIPGLGIAPDVTKQDVLRLLEARSSDQVILEYVRRNGPVQLLSAQDVADLIEAGASDAVIQELLQSRAPASSGSGTVLENPTYYPYYYTYYDHYYPQFYTYPYFSFYFYEPYYYGRHPRYAPRAAPYHVRRFPYYAHEGWRHHPSYPYHSFYGGGVHPWRDGRTGAHGFGPRPGAAPPTVRSGGAGGGSVRSGAGHR